MAYAQMTKLSSRIGENKDCAVSALAWVLGISYEAVHQAMDVAGRAHAEGTPLHITRVAMKALGFRVRREYSAERLGLEVGVRKPKTSDAAANPAAWEHLPPLLLHMHRHSAAFVGGRVEDWTADRDAPIEQAWELERIGTGLRLKDELPPVVYL